jgi:4-hydroxy-4-methyl-2-oxoglutarate aldolase
MTDLPADDAGRFEIIREHLYTAVVGDILDELGRLHQFLPQSLQAIGPGMALVGRAMPVLIADVFERPDPPFGRLTEALDSLRPGEIYLARSGRLECAAWGEILTTTAKARGAAGAVIDGYHRDTRKVLELDWPVYSRGAYGQDAGPRASVRDFRVPVQIGDVTVTPGDLLIGDQDGVVVVPADVEAEVLERALAKATAEGVTLEAIASGMSSSEAYATFGVL